MVWLLWELQVPRAIYRALEGMETHGELPAFPRACTENRVRVHWIPVSGVQVRILALITKLKWRRHTNEQVGVSAGPA
jgi:hypothetical protein